MGAKGVEGLLSKQAYKIGQIGLEHPSKPRKLNPGVSWLFGVLDLFAGVRRQEHEDGNRGNLRFCRFFSAPRLQQPARGHELNLATDDEPQFRQFPPPPTEMPSTDEMLDFWLWDQRFGSLEQRGGGKWIHFGPDDDDDENYDEC